MSSVAPAWAYDLVRSVGAPKVATRDKRATTKPDLPADWQGWLAAVFGSYLRPPFASYHAEAWEWAWRIKPGEPSPPFVAIWSRGFAKSSMAEAMCAKFAATGERSYALYVCSTQDRADDHVQNIANLLESTSFARHYPKAASRRVGKYGNSQGWRRQRLRTADGFTVDAIGLDTAARGVKVDSTTEEGDAEGVRPDFLIFDDIDEPLDSPGEVAKKIKMLTTSILPARSPHAATLVVQNLIHAEGIVARLADGRADFLANRIVSGPHPALRNAAYEQGADGKWRIVAGEPTWEAMGIPELQADLDEIGLTAFRTEKQHEVDEAEGGIFGHLTYRHCAWSELPPLTRIVVWVDPAVTDTDKSDAHGIQADGLAADGTVYRLFSWEQRASPERALREAITKAVDLKAECVGIETDQGGDTWRTTYDAVWRAMIDDASVPTITADTRRPQFRQEKAGAGHGPKAHRASQMLSDYERGKFVHVIGTHETLERGLKRYLMRKPYDLVDAAVWAWHDLTNGLSGQLVF